MWTEGDDSLVKEISSKKEINLSEKSETGFCMKTNVEKTNERNKFSDRIDDRLRDSQLNAETMEKYCLGSEVEEGF
uniref:Uncharacterized protein n=1 Tax=Syphacia muris TaxID=451379 RepID=A0A0N5AIK3_9BILA